MKWLNPEHTEYFFSLWLCVCKLLICFRKLPYLNLRVVFHLIFSFLSSLEVEEYGGLVGAWHPAKVNSPRVTSTQIPQLILGGKSSYLHWHNLSPSLKRAQLLALILIQWYCAGFMIFSSNLCFCLFFFPPGFPGNLVSSWSMLRNIL